MKLASYPDWVQIFFNATTRRQIPFLAVIISLMGDGDDASTLDPVIVSSCVITDDETADVTADGIVKKVRCANGFSNNWYAQSDTYLLNCHVAG